jgi:signal peptidase I
MNDQTAVARELRHEARWRCHVCPGGGFASLGHGAAALVSHAANPAAVLACAVALVGFSRPALLSAAGLLALVLVLYLIEVVAVIRGRVRPRPPSRLRAAFVPLAVTQWALALGLLGVLLATVGHLRIRGGGMAPTLQAGEHLIYRRRVADADLAAGRLVLFRLNPDNSWRQRRLLVTARILAAPGDRIAQHDDRYLVNGKATGQAVGAVDRRRAVEVPEDPQSKEVPTGAYFIVQDHAEKSFDSQVLSWARREDMVSTELRYLWKNGRLLVRIR